MIGQIETALASQGHTVGGPVSLLFVEKDRVLAAGGPAGVQASDTVFNRSGVFGFWFPSACHTVLLMKATIYSLSWVMTPCALVGQSSCSREGHTNQVQIGPCWVTLVVT